MSSAGPDGEAIDLIIVTRSTDQTADALAAALSALHPNWSLSAAWAGDPQQRPTSPTGAAWTAHTPSEIDLCRVSDEDRPWLAGLAAARALLLERRRSIIVLLAGDVAVAGSLSPFAPSVDDGLVLVPRLLGLSTAGCSTAGFPGVSELLVVGAVSSSAIGVGGEALPAIDWLLGEICTGDAVPFGRRLDLASALFTARQCSDTSIGASIWRWPEDKSVCLLDAPRYDPNTSELLDGMLDGPPRVSIARADRLATLRVCAPQLSARDASFQLPGGTPVDAVVQLAVRSPEASMLLPWTRAAEFRAWLNRNYWTALVDLRTDLAAVFGTGQAIDTASLRTWAVGAVRRGEAPLLIDPTGVTDAIKPLEVIGRRTDGVNIVGYLDRQSGVGAVGRAMVRLFDDAGIPHSSIAYQRTDNPALGAPPETHQRIEFATTIACVNGDQIANLRTDHPELFQPGCKVIGYWFWELSTVSGGPPVAVDAVDEIWAATSFMAHAFEGHGAPVRTVPLPIEEPRRSGATRDQLGPLAEAGDRFVFGVVLDHLSVTARKNPLGAITAFTQAFAPDEGPLLVIKTINGETCWREHEELLAAAAQRSDITIWDTHLPIDDHYAFIGNLDALVSLHRSEGLGLHLAEAMWMNVPVIATRYSGNLDFMDDSCAFLVDADLAPVGALGGWVYPAEASWAQPDLDHAAALMRRVYDAPAASKRISDAALLRMKHQPGRQEVAELIASLVGIRH